MTIFEPPKRNTGVVGGKFLLRKQYEERKRQREKERQRQRDKEGQRDRERDRDTDRIVIETGIETEQREGDTHRERTHTLTIYIV